MAFEIPQIITDLRRCDDEFDRIARHYGASGRLLQKSDGRRNLETAAMIESLWKDHFLSLSDQEHGEDGRLIWESPEGFCHIPAELKSKYYGRNQFEFHDESIQMWERIISSVLLFSQFDDANEIVELYYDMPGSGIHQMFQERLNALRGGAEPKRVRIGIRMVQRLSGPPLFSR